MRIEKIDLINFRNYSNISFNFNKTITVIVGPNGVGKTNILEAISVLSLGKSNRAGLEQDLVNVDEPFAKVRGYYSNSDIFEVNIVRKPDSNRVQKTYFINGAKKTITKFVGNSKVINFGPEQIRLVAGSPSRRREHLDKMLSQVFPEYHKNLLKYNRILKQRNKLLDQLRGQIIRTIHEAQLSVWDEQLIQTGQVVQSIRQEFFNYSTKWMSEISNVLYQDEFKLVLRYNQSSLGTEELNRVKNRELVTGTTQIGPHRDDYSFWLIDTKSNERDLKSYGSRGQQRTGVLCVKILELRYLEEKSKSKPILLLDDIFSELDKDYRNAIEGIIHNQQTIITTTDESTIPSSISSDCALINLE